MSSLWMLIGVPGSGKSTYRATLPATATVLSTDDRLELIAAQQGVTYNDVFRDHIAQAEKDMYQQAMQAFARGDDVIWDQTNLTKKTRAKKLILVPDSYEKIGVWFPTPEPAELTRRLQSRPGKTIPANIMLGMASQLQPPTRDEGFDEITVAGCDF
jgi:predicted kinase